MHRTQTTPIDDSSPEVGAGRKVTEPEKALLGKFLREDSHCPSRLVLHAIAESQIQLSVTLRHINRLRKEWGLNRAQGRPRKVGAEKKSGLQSRLVQVTPSLSFVGVHLVAAWMQHQGRLCTVMTLLKQGSEA
jgi:hypothetical protein